MPPSAVEPDTDDPDLSRVPVRTLALVPTRVDLALQDEGLDDELIGRVRNRLVYGHPDGANAVVRYDADEQRTVMRP